MVFYVHVYDSFLDMTVNCIVSLNLVIKKVSIMSVQKVHHVILGSRVYKKTILSILHHGFVYGCSSPDFINH